MIVEKDRHLESILNSARRLSREKARSERYRNALEEIERLNKDNTRAPHVKIRESSRIAREALEGGEG